MSRFWKLSLSLRHVSLDSMTDLTEEVLALTNEENLDLVETIHDAQVTEILEGRERRIETGESAPLPGEEVFARLKREFSNSGV